VQALDMPALAVLLAQALAAVQAVLAAVAELVSLVVVWLGISTAARDKQLLPLCRN
jgi:hypothetical protein